MCRCVCGGGNEAVSDMGILLLVLTREMSISPCHLVSHLSPSPTGRHVAQYRWSGSKASIFLSTYVNLYVWVCKHMYSHIQRPEVSVISLPATFVLIA